MIGQTISHYKILEKLGEGGMGVVYKAEDLTLDRHVALKFLPNELSANEAAKTRFIREAKAASALEHPNICSIYEIDETQNDSLFMVMPCYEGETLGERLEKGPLEIDEALDIALQLLSGLAKAHNKGIVHRDIKPANVLLTDGGRRAILMDFGLAKKLDATKLTRTGMTVGTVAYMSPEQAQGKETDARTDVWSLGVLLYEMLAGSLPFRGDVEPALFYSIINEDPEPVTATRPEVPFRIEAIIEKALNKQVDKRYQGTDEFLLDLKEQRDKWTLGIKERRFVTLARKTRRRILRVSIPAAVIVFAALLTFVYQKFKPIPPAAIALENSMAIMYFENMADPNDSDRTARMITSLLTTGLGDSEYIRVISRQRVHDILKQLGKEEREVVDKDTASEVAKRAGVNWAMTGTVIQTEPNLVVAADVWHSVTGEVRAGVRKRFEVGEDIFAVVDGLIEEVTKDLSLPKAALDGLHRSVTEVTTNSREAYRHYLEGVDRYNKFYYADAIESFEKALEIDSTFAMAYYWISRSGPAADTHQRRAIAKAVQYSNRASRKEKKLISARSARMMGDSEGAITVLKEILQESPDEKQAYEMLARVYRNNADFERAIANWKKVIALDPFDGRTYNMLAYDYHFVGDDDSAIVMINKYISLAPGEANPYDTRGDLYIWQRNIEKAKESYEQAAKIKPGFFSEEKLGDLCAYEGKYDAASEWYRGLLTSERLSVRSRVRLKLAFIPLFKGRLDDALEVLNQGISADQLDGYEGPYHLWKYYHKWLVYAEKHEWAPSLASAEKVFELLEKSETRNRLALRPEYVLLLTQMGDYSAAEETLRVLHGHIDTTKSNDLDRYRFAMSQFEIARGKPEEACTLLETITPDGFQSNGLQYHLGRAYLLAGRLPQAVDMLETYTDTYFVDVVIGLGLYMPLQAAKARYYLGIAYERSGWKDQAAEQYEKFLDMWKDAEPELQEVEDARQRLADCSL